MTTFVFLWAPVLISAIPAIAAAVQRRWRWVAILSTSAVIFVIGAPALLAIWGTSEHRPSALTPILLIALGLVWPLALLQFSIGGLIVQRRGNSAAKNA